VLSIDVSSLAELPAAASRILSEAGQSRIFAFHGQMGAGKTTLIKAICAALGVKDNTGSPTFSLVNEYRTSKGEPVYHFDFYRIKNESEAYDMGYEDYLYSGAYCFIEWPERIPGLIPVESVTVDIEVKDGLRQITLNR
jgi:tRNA threonylcarbamoyladenosine biosynthesis protein TsaE